MESRGCPRLKGKPRPSESSRPIRSAISISILPRFEGKLYLLVAIDRTSKFAFVELRETVSRRDAADFLRRLIGAVPYKVQHGPYRQRNPLHRSRWRLLVAG